MTTPGHSETADARRWWVLSAIGIGTFMSALDGSVVNTVLPLLRRELSTTVAGVQWVTTVYLLVVSALLLGVGRAGDLFGHKRLYLAGFFIFVSASAFCAHADSVEMLVGWRGLQAIGASMLFANAPAILTRSFPAAQRGRALGTQGTFTYLGLTVGPPLGGWLAAAFGWRSVFYINIPIGLIAIVVGLRVIENDRPEGRVERFDFGGAALFSSGLVSLLIALNQGHAWGWAAPRTLVVFAASALLLAGFLVVERFRTSPMLDLGLFANRVFSASASSAVLNYTCVYSVIFLLPFLLIQGRGLSTRDAGVVLMAQPLVMAVVAPLSGTLSDKFGSRLLTTTGMIIMAVGIVLLALNGRAAVALIAASLAVVGLGVGIFVSPNNSALMGAAPRHRQGIASGVLATARNVGMVLGVGIAGAIFTTALAKGGAGALFHGVRESLLVAAAIALAGAAVSFFGDRGA